MFSLSNNSQKNREGVDPKLIEISELAITLTLVDFGHGLDSGKRIASQQFGLYRLNKSLCDGYKIISNHQTGKALDFYAYVDGKASWDEHHLAMVACAFFQAAAILGYKIRWGGLWKAGNPEKKNGIPYGWDCPHIELI